MSETHETVTLEASPKILADLQFAAMTAARGAYGDMRARYDHDAACNAARAYFEACNVVRKALGAAPMTLQRVVGDLWRPFD